ncbi:MAG: hypothetical protein V2B15_12005 [Bacteroidota bacterium]
MLLHEQHQWLCTITRKRNFKGQLHHRESSEVNISIGKIITSLIGTKTYDITPFMYWDASGPLILDYAVSRTTAM